MYVGCWGSLFHSICIQPAWKRMRLAERAVAGFHIGSPGRDLMAQR